MIKFIFKNLYLVGEIKVDEQPTTRFPSTYHNGIFRFYVPVNLFNFKQSKLLVDTVLGDIVRLHVTDFQGRVYLRVVQFKDLTDDIF